MKKIKIPGSATVINAISTGKGAAFGISLYITAEIKLNKFKIKCTSEQSVDTKLMENCVKKVLNHYKIDTGVSVNTTSTLPVASGLSSSSAVSNAIIKGVSDLISESFNLKPLTDLEILDMAIDTSLESKISVTGSFDDAIASYYGGLFITDNYQRRIIDQRTMHDQKILIYIPNKNKEIITSESDVEKIKTLSPLIDTAFQKLIQGNVYDAINLNGVLHCAALGFDPSISVDALNAGALASGLSGTGPSFITIVEDRFFDNVNDVLMDYPGKIIETKLDNTGVQVL